MMTWLPLSLFWISRQKSQGTEAANWILISDFEQRLEGVLKFPKLPPLMALLVKFVNKSAFALTVNDENAFFAFGDLLYWKQILFSKIIQII